MTVLDTCSGAPTPTGGASFPGFGEGAPLDLSSLSDREHAGLLSRLVDGSHRGLSDAIASVGNCSHPIRLVGSSQTIDRATGEVVSSYSSQDAPLGELLVPCGNRRASWCPACSRVYARDTFELIRAGVVGGKTVPASVAGSPLLFVTFTAPSFGHVHGLRPDGGRCRPRSSDRVTTCEHGVRLSCNASHAEGDAIVGSPLCWDCYDWTSAVVWQWHAPELWRRTTIAVRRALAQRLGIKRSKLNDVASVQFAKVGEYQERGLIHFHALIRLDGPDGPGSPAPLDGLAFADVIRTTAPLVTVTAPPTDEDDRARTLAWGRQLDVRVINTGGRVVDDARTADELTPEQVAGYLAKYATKDATDLRHGDTRQRPHLARMTRECRRLHRLAVDRGETRRCGDPTVAPALPDGSDPYALLGKWAHMLGFRGHFSTKSRRYSVTLGRLRRARARYMRLVQQAERDRVPLDVRDLETRLLADDDEDETTLVVGSWVYAGSGWPRPGDAALATAAAARAREYAQWKAEQRRTSPTNTKP
ncbi:replication initiator [Arsenicicoccus bolidensis]|uniref:Replication initiation protein n=1 Tax=Arsenicicoccus bolidensis TaxID=229480 RepID=A0ABS9PYU5_9MICO|nr:replication initiator [Arsenicicoccus bolidensis]MCG7320808.1 replication initiation protein [Arsenicicoccus bolidensis]